VDPDTGAVQGHGFSAGKPVVDPGHTVVWSSVGGHMCLGTQGVLEYSLVIPPPTDPVAAVPWESAGARKLQAATITLSFSCSRDTAGVDVGCSAGNIEVVKDVEQVMDRMVEATIVVSVGKDGGPVPVTAPAPAAVAQCHASRVAREQALNHQLQNEKESVRRAENMQEANFMRGAYGTSYLPYSRYGVFYGDPECLEPPSMVDANGNIRQTRGFELVLEESDAKLAARQALVASHVERSGEQQKYRSELAMQKAQEQAAARAEQAQRAREAAEAAQAEDPWYARTRMTDFHPSYAGLLRPSSAGFTRRPVLNHVQPAPMRASPARARPSSASATHRTSYMGATSSAQLYNSRGR